MDTTQVGETNRHSTCFCDCYKTMGLTETILELTQVSNLRDRYVLGEQLGWGQFGVIRACYDKLTGEMLACKSIAKGRLMTRDDVRNVTLEIEIMTRLSGHPNVVDLKAVYEEEDYVHLVMELCAGGELFHKLEEQGMFSERVARDVFRHLMQVVMYCHEKGVVHRDLKPENILLTTKSSSSPIKLADFGLATYIKPGQTLHETVGSPFYIAPEVLAGGYNQAADLWSSGVILYILLSGRPPFWGKTKSRIFDAVRAADLWFPPTPWDYISPSAKDLVTGMLCVDPSKRLTAAQVLAHSWLKDCVESSQEPYKHDPRSRQLEVGGSSFSAPLIARNQDYSFSHESPITSDDQMGTSPAFMCRSSFSTFLADNSAPCSVSGGFSFNSCCESAAASEFPSLFPSLPSFTFFSPSSEVDRGNHLLEYKANLSILDATSEVGRKPAKIHDTLRTTSNHNFVMEDSANSHGRRSLAGPRIHAFHAMAVGGGYMLSEEPFSLGRKSLSQGIHVLESSLSKTLVFSDSPPAHPERDSGETEIRRGGTSGSRASVIHSKRNHTIGVGEHDHDQMELIAAESVIRWASCTHIQGAPSLRSSLVC